MFSLLFIQVKIWFQNRRMKWKRGKKASMEARSKHNSDVSKNKPETGDTPRKQETTTDRHVISDSVHNNNNNNGHVGMSRVDSRSLVEHAPPVINKMALTGNGPIEFFGRRPASVIAFSVPATHQSSVSASTPRGGPENDRDQCRESGPNDRKPHNMASSAYGSYVTHVERSLND